MRKQLSFLVQKAKRLFAFAILGLLFSSCNDANTNLKQLVIFEIKPEFNKEFQQVALQSKVYSLAEEGNISMKLFTDPKQENKLYVYSVWKNKEVYSWHQKQEYTKSLQALAKKSLLSAPQIIELKENESDIEILKKHSINLKELK